MANEIDLTLLTDDDYQDYYNQFLRLYADESGKNLSKKLPISYLNKLLSPEIIEKYEIQLERYNSKKFIEIVQQLIKKGVIEFETLRPEQKFTDRYAIALSKIISKIKINPKYRIKIDEPRINSVYVQVTIDMEDLMKLSSKDKEQADKFHTTLKSNIQRFLGVEFGEPSHGKLDLHGYGVYVQNEEEWIKNVMNNVIKKEIKKSKFTDYIQRMSIVINSNGIKISIVSPTNRRMNRYYEVRNEFDTFMKDLFEKYGYDKSSFKLDFI